MHACRPPAVVVTDERFSQTIGQSDAAVLISELASSDHAASTADGTNLADVGPSPAPASPPRAPGTNIAIHVDTEVADTTQPWTEPASSSRGTEEVSGQERTTDDEVSESPADGEVSTPKFVTRAIGRMSSAVSFDGLRKVGGWKKSEKKSGKKSVEILVHIDGSAMDNMQDRMMTQVTVEDRWLNKSVRDAVLVGLLRHLNSGQPEERKLMMADVSNVMIQGVPASVDDPFSHYAPKDGQEPVLMSVVLKKLPNSSVTVTWMTAFLPLPFGFSFDRETNHILSILPESETERDGTLRVGDEIISIDGVQLKINTMDEVVDGLSYLPQHEVCACRRSTVANPSASASPISDTAVPQRRGGVAAAVQAEVRLRSNQRAQIPEGATAAAPLSDDRGSRCDLITVMCPAGVVPGQEVGITHREAFFHAVVRAVDRTPITCPTL